MINIPHTVTFTLILCLNYLFGFSQFEVMGSVVDAETGQALAFVTIAADLDNTGTYTDIDGNFLLKSPQMVHQLQFNYLGYEGLEIAVTGEEVHVALQPSSYQMAEVVVTPGTNPAHRIVREMIAHKDQNNPEKGGGYTCETYNKFVFSYLPDSSILTHPETVSSLDSNTQEILALMEKQYILMMESVTQKKFLPPDFHEENIVANKFSGFKNPKFALIASQLQSFSFYEAQIQIGDYRYLSPTSNHAISKYLFVLEKSTSFDGDTLYEISYRPRKGKNFSGLKGVLFIQGPDFAIRQVIGEPFFPEDGFNIKIQQKYEKIDQQHWFPVQLNSFLNIPPQGNEPLRLQGVGRSYLRNILFTDSLKKRNFDRIAIKIDPEAGTREPIFWSQHRQDSLSIKEQTTYHVVDSIGEAMGLDKLAGVIESLATGILPLGKVGLELDKLINFNNHEGMRLGIGLRVPATKTRSSLGGYFAYGMKDKGNKYGGDLRVNLSSRRQAYFKASVRHDVVESGGISFLKNHKFTSQNQYYLFFMERMDLQDRGMLQLNTGQWRGFQAIFYGSRERRQVLDDYQFVVANQETVNLKYDLFNITEVGFKMRFSIKENFVQTGNQVVSVGSKYPKLHLNVIKGLNAAGGEFDYFKTEIMTESRWAIPSLGTFEFRVAAGKTTDNLPATLLYNTRGTYSNFAIASPYAFETMRVNEFQSSEFVHVHLRHNFEQLLFRMPRFEPEISIIYNGGWGTLTHPASHTGITVQSYPKGYSEAGVQINALYKLNFTAVGLGGFYRFGAYAFDRPQDNFVLKLSVLFSM